MVSFSQSTNASPRSESLRSIPVIREKYQVDYPKDYIAKRMRVEWENNRGLKDHKMIDVLVFKGWNELDEAKFLWKQRPHIMAFLAPQQQPDPASKKNAFLSKFFSGQEIDY